ncbi:hypothetical protein CFC21_021655 [Triticum aestivum]|uniref:Cathepsin propeptide inhibitor domain-containing protein n=2 Tax=Triticum aestivum TaxID=4565 RepID=A0A3B6UC28_WHEAT|nr:uncharacterized protein LOC123040567 [Triticum aestivum]XP_044319307.1 uncharacterized protein LOC123040568 [Triticum aestivum]XP_044319308.1 uncharacterized protein LOC123040569 [Triticum aestivum]XP_044446573.1 uncharacterized protein LOC123176436 [Triticum aestivum]KAF7006627.1 hypothetical protein CFC21_021655 [Triticum aestivum]
MAFIVSKLARAAFASRSVRGARLPQTAGAIRRMSAAAGGCESEEDHKNFPPVDTNFNFIEWMESCRYESGNDPNFPLVDENSTKSKESLWALYESWCKYYEVSRDREEMVRRFRSFKASAMRVYKMNNSGSSQVSQLSAFADLTKAEADYEYSRLRCRKPKFSQYRATR